MKKVLIVDDEEFICKIYAEELKESGYHVLWTDDGSRVMRLIEEYQPDLVVLDIRMGEYDGLDILQDIRNTHYEMPVILCSAYSSFKYDLRAVAANYYVLKSADLTELKVKVNMAFEGSVFPLTVKYRETVAHHHNMMVRNITNSNNRVPN